MEEFTLIIDLKVTIQFKFNQTDSHSNQTHANSEKLDPDHV